MVTTFGQTSGWTPPAGLEEALAAARLRHRAGDLREAERICREVLRVCPDHPEALYRLARINIQAGVPGFAIAFISRALAIAPNEVSYHRVLVDALRGAGRLAEAEAGVLRALTLAPGDTRLLESYSAVLMAQGRLTEALAALQQALQTAPESSHLYHSLGAAQVRAGLPADAVASFRRAVELDPAQSGAAAGALFSQHYLPVDDLAALANEAKAWGQRYADPLARGAPPHDNDPDPDRRLRIGYVSPDFHEHPVGRILNAVLPAHDPSQVEIYCYANRRCVDQIASQIYRAADHWRSLVHLDDDAAAALIRSDKIDILVDLSGHTAQNRLLTLARRPAPVQALWLGYFDTTGMSSVDYLIADRIVCHPEDERFYVERVARLPHSFLYYSPLEASPDVAPVPVLSRGHVTFGSLNNIAKITPEVIAVWATVLHRVPGSRLSLKYFGLNDPGIQHRFQTLFAAHEITPDRVTLLGRSGLGEHLAAYNAIDIALDPFPYNGGITSLDALWMGVPVLSLEGDRFVSRMGASILAVLGLPDLIAKSPAEYVQKAVELAMDRKRLADLRSSLRDTLARSPLCDGTRAARDLETLYREMWHGWCRRAQRALPAS